MRTFFAFFIPPSQFLTHNSLSLSPIYYVNFSANIDATSKKADNVLFSVSDSEGELQCDVPLSK